MHHHPQHQIRKQLLAPALPALSAALLGIALTAYTTAPLADEPRADSEVQAVVTDTPVATQRGGGGGAGKATFKEYGKRSTAEPGVGQGKPDCKCGESNCAPCPPPPAAGKFKAGKALADTVK